MEIISLYYGNGDFANLERLLKNCNLKTLGKLSAFNMIDGLVLAVCSSENIKNLFPGDFLDDLRKRAGVIVIKNSFISENGLEIIRILNENGIDYLLVKGIATLKHLYDDDTFRAVSDLDILVKPEQYRQVIGLLTEKGFNYYQDRTAKMDWTLTREQFENEYYEIELVKEAVPFPIQIDLHFDLSGFRKKAVLHQLYPINGHDWFGNTRILEVEGCPVKCLNNEMALLNMIYHFSIHHSFMGLKWLLDICQMVVKYNEEIDWDKVNKAAQNPNLGRLIGISLHLANEITGITSFGPLRLDDFALKPNSINKYRNMMFIEPHSLKAKIRGRFLKASLPVSLADKIKVLKYYLLDRDSIIHRTGGRNRGGVNLLQPLRLVGIVLKDLVSKGKDKTE